MLGRHGNNLYWMARYLERSENNARRIQATLHHYLSHKDEDHDEWGSIVAVSGFHDTFNLSYENRSMTNVINFLLRDRKNLNSIAVLMSNARQNGRSVRAYLTQEVWQSLNECWINCEYSLKRQVSIQNLPIILEDIVKGSSLFRGSLYGTMLHNDIFNFLRLGTFIERADNTARAINEKYYLLLETATTIGGQEDKPQWEILLRSLSAWRSFNWLKTGRLKPNEISDFLIFDKRMPRSIFFCVKELKENLDDLAVTYSKPYDSSELSNKLFSDLNVSSVANENKIDLRNFISNLIIQINTLNQKIGNDFNF